MGGSSPSEVTPTDEGAKPKVIYVMGAGRSGSTVLGVTLGNCANVFHAGELNKWLARSGVPTLQDSERMRFWTGVRENVADAEALFGGQASRLERSSALFRIDGWRARRRLRERYRRIAEDLYHVIARAAGVTHIVDTSHYPMRARELQSLSGIDLYLVFLVRNPQSVVASLNREDVPERSFDMPTTNAYLWLTNLLSALVFLRHPRERRLFLRHEDFLADPEGVLRQILDQVDSSAAIPDLTALKTGLPLHGNRLIKAEVIALRGEAHPPGEPSRVTTLLQLPLTALLSRLRPAVTTTASRHRVSASS